MSYSKDRRSEWERLISEYHASGMTINAWCTQNGIKKNTFYNWRKLLSSSPVQQSAPQWLAVAPSDALSASHSVTLRVGKVSLEVSAGFDSHLLRDVLSVLESRC